MYEVTCLYCGTVKVYDSYGPHPMKFCNAKCQAAMAAKRKREKHLRQKEGRIVAKLSPTITPESQCKKCRYGLNVGQLLCCSYFEIMGTTRLKKHNLKLPSECQEFEPKTRANNRTEMTVKQKRK